MQVGVTKAIGGFRGQVLVTDGYESTVVYETDVESTEQEARELAQEAMTSGLIRLFNPGGDAKAVDAPAPDLLAPPATPPAGVGG